MRHSLPRVGILVLVTINSALGVGPGDAADAVEPSGAGVRSGWEVANGGEPIDAGEVLSEHRGDYTDRSPAWAHVASVVDGDGRLVYLFHSSRWGTGMGRLSFNDVLGKWEWELWTPSGWSTAGDAVPAAVDHATGHYGRMRLFRHPASSGGLLGVASSELRTGLHVINVHGFPANFIFAESTGFQQWKGENLYDSLFNRPLIRSGKRDSSEWHEANGEYL